MFVILIRQFIFQELTHILEVYIYKTVLKMWNIYVFWNIYFYLYISFLSSQMLNAGIGKLSVPAVK
jgi:hypothetical protein